MVTLVHEEHYEVPEGQLPGWGYDYHYWFRDECVTERESWILSKTGQTSP